jgi:3'5'-cyclic nucleotide phosphodiesterase
MSCLRHRYRDNPFHCFEHASHVTMSVTKLLTRIVAPTAVLQDFDNKVSNSSVVNKDDVTVQERLALTLHDHTYGITSDPLTQFSVVFSALVHDVDHQGIPNKVLVEENAILAAMYNNQSVAEQNSVDLAWELFMLDDFAELRQAICATEGEFKRFRQLVVNTVLATDILDTDLKAIRNGRWEKAFSPTTHDRNPQDSINRKATIVIEHLIQASDVAHTMQHWHIYHKWNERLFREMYKAYAIGRLKQNPVDFWYKGELGFFDFYIIPLAKKLKSCGVFGVSSDEYLDYALENRRQWEDRGADIVAEYAERVRKSEFLHEV